MRSPVVTLYISSLLLICAKAVFSQDLNTALASNAQLSEFASLVQSLQGVQNAINGVPKSPSILAPTNDALNAYALANNYSSAGAVPKGMMATALSYHVLTSNYSIQELGTNLGVAAMSQLTDPTYALLPMDQSQAVYANSDDDGTTVTLTSGLQQTINIVKGESVVYNNGTIHVVNGILTLPKKCSSTLQHAGATELVRYLNRTNLAEPLDRIPGATCFAPSDSALKSMTSQLEAQSDEELSNTLMNHVADKTYYLTDFTDGQVFQTHTGYNVTVSIRNGTYYFNNFKALSVRNIAQNGVAYIIDGVLVSSNSSSATSSAFPTATTSATSTTISTSSSSGTTTTGAPAPATTSKPSIASPGFVLYAPTLLFIIIMNVFISLR